MERYVSHYPSPMGSLCLIQEEAALVELRLPNQQAALPADAKAEETPLLQQVRIWLDCYFAGDDPGVLPVAIRPNGSPFARQVWGLLSEIPYGRTTTYGAIAARLGAARGMRRMSAQAVGNALGRNPIAIVIPCHRVLGADGSLTGYAGGVDKKKFLLQLEGVL